MSTSIPISTQNQTQTQTQTTPLINNLKVLNNLNNGSKSLPPSPITNKDQHYYYSKSQHNSPCILSQIQQAREILNTIEQQYILNNNNNTNDNSDSFNNNLKEVQNSIIEINNNVLNSGNINNNPNINNIINDNLTTTIINNVSPLIISEGNPIILNNNNNTNNNNQHAIEMNILPPNNKKNNNLNSIDDDEEMVEISVVGGFNNDSRGGGVNIITNGAQQQEEEDEVEDEISEAQRIREERIQEIRTSIQNETLLNNFTKWNIAYGLLGFLTVISTVCMFIMGFVNTKDNIIYAGIGLSTLGFIVINHSIHIAYKKSRRNIEQFQEEFIRIHEASTNDSNVDPTTIPSKLEKLSIGVLSSPNLEKPLQTPKLSPKTTPKPNFYSISIPSPVIQTNTITNNNATTTTTTTTDPYNIFSPTINRQ